MIGYFYSLNFSMRADSSYQTDMRTSLNILLAFIATLVMQSTANAVEPLVQHTTITALDTSRENLVVTQDDLWARVRNGFALPYIENQDIREHENNFKKHQRFIDRIVDRSQRYLFHIMEEVEQRGMPTEIALLPIIESAFDPEANSHKNAAGLWQFIPSTGKAFGLEQNWWHDERRDVVAATNAALDYLQKLHKMFGNWKMALAAYNWGEGSLKKAIDDSNGNASDLNTLLPSETRNYVAKLIAIRNIIANPRRFGIHLKPIPNQPYFEQITITQQIDVKLAARLAGITENEFNALNPAHHRPIIKVSNSPRTLLIPATKIQTFVDNLENYDKALVSWRVYKVKQTETVETLSKRYRISPTILAETNGLARRTALKQGQTILVPRDGSTIRERTYLAHSNSPQKSVRRSQFEQFITYVVRKGDTLYDIAKRYGIDVKAIKSMNGGSDRLSIGQKLTLKLPSSARVTLYSS